MVKLSNVTNPGLNKTLKPDIKEAAFFLLKRIIFYPVCNSR